MSVGGGTIPYLPLSVTMTALCGRCSVFILSSWLTLARYCGVVWTSDGWFSPR